MSAASAAPARSGSGRGGASGGDEDGVGDEGGAHPLSPPDEVAAVGLLAKRTPAQRLDGWPLAIVDSFVVAWSLHHGHSLETTLLLAGMAAALHALVVLSSQWSLRAKCFLRYTKESSLSAAGFARVDVLPHRGKPAVVLIARDSRSGAHVCFQNLEYTLAQGADGAVSWRPREYPVDWALAAYHASRGHDEAGVDEAQRLWGTNEYDIPLPSFGELFAQQLMAPMFIFQLFCMLLFFLDEYWWLSAFTLTMLLFIEGTVVKQRLMNMRELRQMGAVDNWVFVYRKRQWRRVRSDELVPGDLCSVPRGPVPADVLLLSGTCIVNEAMLTGESVPQVKEAAPRGGSGGETLAAVPNPKLHVVFRGTEVVQVSPPSKDFDGVRCTAESASVGFVLRTGFATEQGNLLRTIISNTGRVSANNLEMFLFILFLLAFAVAASSYVFFARVENTKKLHKLIVECLLIITAVVPPELPVQLNLAVNNALLKLREKAVTCTEPFRIPFAGKLDVCCFDKTGTLTEGTFVVNGVAGLAGDAPEVIPLDSLTAEFPVEARVLAACHAVAHVGTTLVGDPLELAMLRALRWQFSAAEVASPLRELKVEHQSVRVLKRFYFSSNLKRMSTLGVVSNSSGDSSLAAFCKGAPETLKGRFTSPPAHYDEMYERHARQGARVLALGYRILSTDSSRVKAGSAGVSREDAESGLTFAGFLVVSSPVKMDAADAVTRLVSSSHHVVMITGDNPLTACHVAGEVGIADSAKPFVSLAVRGGDARGTGTGDGAVACEWVGANGATVSPFAPGAAAVGELHSKFEMCITGPAVAELVQSGHLSAVLPFATVYARTTPSLKAAVVSAYNDAGLQTMMCGDGTNDVAALRRAHVGIALTPGHVDAKRKKGRRGGGGGGGGGHPPRDPLADAAAQEYAPPKLGDAVMASSFTSRSPSVLVACTVIRQGRCTLVTATQMLRILALNCLMNSYGMSVLYMRGVKFGDTQLTFNAFFMAFSMFALTRAVPLKDLAPQRPTESVLSPVVMLSILGQFAVHVAALSRMVSVASELTPPPPFDPEADPESEEGKFKVSLLNTTVYLVTWGFQLATIVVNYNGVPFMQPLKKNIWLSRSVKVFAVVAVLAASGVSSGFGDFLELEPDMPASFRATLLGCMLLDVAAAWAVDAAVRALFPLSAESKVVRLRGDR